jgi:ubiquitin-conjugating enzyme E2 M
MSEPGDPVEVQRAAEVQAQKVSRTLLKELHLISKRGVFDDQVEFSLGDPDDATRWTVELRPDGLYEGGRFVFELVFANYPDSPPRVTCNTPIYHPNISSPSVCFNMFDSGSDGWNASLTAEHYINGLLWLVRNPNFDSLLNGNVSSENFEATVRLSLRGKEILGVQYQRFILEEDEPQNEVEDDNAGSKDESADEPPSMSEGVGRMVGFLRTALPPAHFTQRGRRPLNT